MMASAGRQRIDSIVSQFGGWLDMNSRVYQFPCGAIVDEREAFIYPNDQLADLIRTRTAASSRLQSDLNRIALWPDQRQFQQQTQATQTQGLGSLGGYAQMQQRQSMGNSLLDGALGGAGQMQRQTGGLLDIAFTWTNSEQARMYEAAQRSSDRLNAAYATLCNHEAKPATTVHRRPNIFRRAWAWLMRDKPFVREPRWYGWAGVR